MAGQRGLFDPEEDDDGSYVQTARTSGTASVGGGAAAQSFGGGGGGGQLTMLSMYTGSRRRGAYREWRKEVTAFMCAFQIPPEQQAPRI